MKKFVTVNPATEEVINEYLELNDSQIDRKITEAHSAFEKWQRTAFEKRADLMKNAGKILMEKKEKYAELMALEMGKPILQGIAEAEKCAWVCNYYSEKAQDFLHDEIIQTEWTKSYVAFVPLGVVLAVMPWNFPFWQVFRFAAPALMAGNAGLLKHARNTMGCAIEIEKIFLEAGFPEGLFSNLVISSGPVAKIIEHPLVKAVTLTGSTPVGMEVASKAGSQVKKTVLELGGSDPYIILEDADIEKAAQTCATARLINSGQSCIAAKRFIVVEKVLSEFEGLFTSNMQKAIMGNPLDRNTTLGPQARKDLQLDLQRQVDDSVHKGAKTILGGEIPESKGYFYPATVVTNVKKGMALYDEEVFGPVAAVISAKDENETIKTANDSPFGLGAAIFTGDIEKGDYIAKNLLNAGCCFVNDFVKSDPRLPFGGINQSGYGRELSVFGIREFVNIKTVCLK